MEQSKLYHLYADLSMAFAPKNSPHLFYVTQFSENKQEIYYVSTYSQFKKTWTTNLQLISVILSSLDGVQTMNSAAYRCASLTSKLPFV